MPMPFRTSTAVKPSVKNANKTVPPSTIRLEGWLNKQKHGKCKAWLKRYFVLYGEELRYYKNKNDINALAVISLDHYSLVPNAQPLTSLNQKQWRYNTFCLVSDDDAKFDWPDYYLQAEDVNERNKWIDGLQRHVSQSKSVLEKWLERLEMPQADITEMTTIYVDKNSNTSSSTLPSTQGRLTDASVSSELLPPPHQSLRSHKSVESLGTFTTKSTSSDGYRRRPSDFASSRSTDLSSKLFNSKIFNWTRPRSSASSVTSSSRSIDTNIIENDSRDLLSAPNTPLKPIESPIIHPSEYNREDNPSDYTSTLRQDTTAPIDNTTNYFYVQKPLY
ncbi:hypothetical protein BDF21DRAFT_490624 [Thamnidium elegans]|uniref:PH domain-containing protein n=1 Tax=Thamnidium elegans TaxID=101142 RepID=A0A8H7VY98_9FUNG|nr:hypothetical protein INT48_003694 [Thamnidium elegans]KAI8091953.1 hypothetical protein BDF21DRAFT_490624 [Thamnidium elegans]